MHTPKRTGIIPEGLAEKFTPAAMIWIYAVLSFIISLLLLKDNIHPAGNDYYTAEGLPLSFLKLSAFTAAFLVLSFHLNRLSQALMASAIIVPGIFIRLCYTAFTDAGTRTYDVYRDSWGHLDYIKYIAQNLSLPPVNECQAYHPPVHHIISAITLNLSKLLTQKEFFQLKAIQLVMVIISSLTLILFHKILKELECSNTAVVTALSLFAFHPTNIYFSSRINNDNVLMFFYTLSVFFMIKWLKSTAVKDIIMLALSAALAILTKFSGIMLVPLITFAFAAVLSQNKDKFRPLLKQLAVFTAVYTPLSISYLLRNLILFNQSISYVPDLGKGFTPTFYNLLHVPVGEIISNPFNNGGLVGGEYFMEFFLKSSLFGEWQYPKLETLARPMLALSAAFAVIIAVYLICSRSPKKGKALKACRVLLIFNLLIPVILEMKFRTDLPIACSQDFRYAAPVLISAFFFLGEIAGRLQTSGHKVLKLVSATAISAFCILSAIFIFSLQN